MIAIVDYGIGNLFSIRSSLEYIGIKSVVTGDREVLFKADKIILPGVGAFRDAINKLQETGLDAEVKNLAKAKPLLGICLGMQLLYEKSFEFGEYNGLGLIKGSIYPLENDLKSAGLKLKVPHIGWNPLIFQKPCPLTKNIAEGAYVYYVHSYYAKVDGQTAAYSEYGVPVTGLVQNGQIFGTQFHPEKSGDAGLKILQAFAAL